MTDIKSMLLSELQEDFALRGLQKFRAAQVYRWLHQRGATSFDEMTDLSKDLRVALKESFEIRNTEIAIRRVSKIDGTKKYLFRLNDGEMIESVLMKYKHGYSICISTQVGCKMGCTFCATGKSGFSRDLLPSEMISEIQTRYGVGFSRHGKVLRFNSYHATSGSTKAFSGKLMFISPFGGTDFQNREYLNVV